MSGVTHDELPQRARGRKDRHLHKEGDVSEKPGEKEVCMRERPGKEYEFLDHTADVQIHSWGRTVEEVFENQGLGMFDYMTDRTTVEPKETITFEVTDAHDYRSLLYKFMDELLFHFSAEFFTLHEVRITSLNTADWSLKGTAWGERWDRNKHAIGTEIKAITFASLRVIPPDEDAQEDDYEGVRPPPGNWSAYVVVDI
eukprot:TRINITY_DN43736_c0_g1_i1.p1 TRINITY_DN43736_c0_g1~~TRINITY_DN43736_c0_g1_i1.p1  ORF type:complete len:218 (+),score=40.53 TRINITY_DN43736_c0_g1_i1:59-655(+)